MIIDRVFLGMTHTERERERKRRGGRGRWRKEEEEEDLTTAADASILVIQRALHCCQLLLYLLGRRFRIRRRISEGELIHSELFNIVSYRTHFYRGVV